MWLRLSFVIRTLFGNKGLAFATRQVRWLTFAVRLKELTHGILDAISIRREPILVELGGSCISRSSPFPYLFPLRSCRAARKTLTIMGRVANDLNNSGGPCAIKSTNFNEVTVTAVELRPRKVALGIVTWCTKRPAQGGLVLAPINIFSLCRQTHNFLLEVWRLPDHNVAREGSRDQHWDEKCVAIVPLARRAHAARPRRLSAMARDIKARYPDRVQNFFDSVFDQRSRSFQGASSAWGPGGPSWGPGGLSWGPGGPLTGPGFRPSACTGFVCSQGWVRMAKDKIRTRHRCGSERSARENIPPTELTPLGSTRADSSGSESDICVPSPVSQGGQSRR